MVYQESTPPEKRQATAVFEVAASGLWISEVVIFIFVYLPGYHCWMRFWIFSVDSMRVEEMEPWMWMFSAEYMHGISIAARNASA